MDQIEKAIEKARIARKMSPRVGPPIVGAGGWVEEATSKSPIGGHTLELAHLDPHHLEQQRIVAHQSGSPLSIPFDLLRTKVFLEMESRGWHKLAITSPGMDCGKSVTIINLAISMARKTEGLVVLVDCDFRKPHIASYLGLRVTHDIHDVLAGRVEIEEALVGVDIAGPRLAILPSRTPVSRPAEVLASPAMTTLLGQAGRWGDAVTVLVDTPPMLVADDVLAFAAQVDGILLVSAAGITKADEIDECLRHIPEEKLLGHVLTMSKERSEGNLYYEYS